MTSKQALYQLRRMLGLCVACSRPAATERIRCLDCLNDAATEKGEVK